MTTSLYVSGTLGDVDSVLVDIGTGYFVKKNVDESGEYLERKIALLKVRNCSFGSPGGDLICPMYVSQENLDKVQEAIQTKRKNLESVCPAACLEAPCLRLLLHFCNTWPYAWRGIRLFECIAYGG